MVKIKQEERENMHNKYYKGIVILFLVAILAACGAKIGEMETYSTNVDFQGEKALDVSIRLGAGDLTINGETEKVADVDFSYNVEKLKPIVDYSIVEQDIGQLAISQSNMNVPIGNLKGLEYSGIIHINPTIPVNIQVKTGAGNNTLELQHLNLQKAEIISGVGQTTINMNGNYKQNFDAVIESGVGQTKIMVPENIGVKIMIDSGIGKVDTFGLLTENDSTYVNHAYGKSNITVNMRIKMGVGDVEIIEGSIKN